MKSIRSSMLFKDVILAIGALAAYRHSRPGAVRHRKVHPYPRRPLGQRASDSRGLLVRAAVPEFAGGHHGRQNRKSADRNRVACRSLDGKTQPGQHHGADSYCGRRIIRKRAVPRRPRFKSLLFGTQIAGGNRIGEAGTHRRGSTRQVNSPRGSGHRTWWPLPHFCFPNKGRNRRWSLVVGCWPNKTSHGFGCPVLVSPFFGETGRGSERSVESRMFRRLANGQ